MSSAVPIHPFIRLVRHHQRSAQLAAISATGSFASRSRRFTASATVRAASRNAASGPPSRNIQAASSANGPSSAPSSSNTEAGVTAALDASAAARAYAASSRRKKQLANNVKLTDQRANTSSSSQDEPKIKRESSTGAVSSTTSKSTSVEGGAQKMLGKEPSSSKEGEQAKQDDKAASNQDSSSQMRVSNETRSQVDGARPEQISDGVIISADASSRHGSPDNFPFSTAFSQGVTQHSTQQNDEQRVERSPSSGHESNSGGGSSNSAEDGAGLGNTHLRRNLILYPFNTHEFIKHLQQADFISHRLSDAKPSEGNSEETSLTANKRHDPAEAIMEAVQGFLIARGQYVVDNNMNKTEVENQAYLFTAALAELRTELQVMARNDASTLRSMVTLLQREVDSLNQRMREDVDAMKHDIQVDMNNRKSEAKEEQNTLEQEIQDLNNRFTISISDLKTEIEQSIKWDATRRALTIFFGCIVILIATLAAADYLTREDAEVNIAGDNKSARAGREPTESKPKSAEELGLVANYDEEHSSRYV